MNDTTIIKKYDKHNFRLRAAPARFFSILIFDQLIASLLKASRIISQVSAPDLPKFTQNLMHVCCSFKSGIVKIETHLCNCLLLNVYSMLYVLERSLIDIDSQLKNCISRCNNVVYYFSFRLRTKN